MITIKNKSSILKMEEAGRLLSDIMCRVESCIKPGVSTLDIDHWIEQEMRVSNLLPRCKGYHGYRHVSCISINDEVVHGVPSKHKILQVSDIVKIDVCASFKGYCADMARVFVVQHLDNEQIKKLILVAYQALDAGIQMMRAGNRLGDVSAAIQHVVESHGFGIVRDFAGHGIGKQMHEEPELLNYGIKGTGPVLQPGMAFAIEPMITLGHYDVYVADDGWTVRTKDKSFAVHVEDTVIVTQADPKVITRYKDSKG